MAGSVLIGANDMNRYKVLDENVVNEINRQTVDFLNLFRAHQGQEPRFFLDAFISAFFIFLALTLNKSSYDMVMSRLHGDWDFLSSEAIRMAEETKQNDKVLPLQNAPKSRLVN